MGILNAFCKDLFTNTYISLGIHEAPFNSSKELNKISVAFAVQIFNSTEYINNMYWLGVAVEIGPDLIWAAQLGVTVVESDTLLGMVSQFKVKALVKTTGHGQNSFQFSINCGYF